MFGFVKKIFSYISNKLFGKSEKPKEINRLDNLGYHNIHSAIANDDTQQVQSILNNPSFDLQQANSENDLLYECAMHGRNDMAKVLMNKGLSLDAVVDDKGITAKNAFALNDDAKSFFKEVGAFQNDQEIDDYVKLSRSKAILNLSYSNESFGARPSVYRKILHRAISDSDFAYKDDALHALDLVKSDGQRDVKMQNGNRLRVEKVAYQGHAAYFIVESDQQNNPLKITYCDGNDVLKNPDHKKKGPKALTFELDPAKVRTKGNWLESIQEDFRSCESSHDMYDNHGEKFLKTMAKIAKCDKKGQPVICDKSVHAKDQERGNCALKSFNIIFRELINRLNPGINFGKKSADGNNLYKDYKHSITKKPVQDLLELAGDRNKGKDSHKEALSYLKESVFLKTVAKNDVPLLQKIKGLFDSNGIDISSIKSQNGKDATYIAQNQGCQETLNWLKSPTASHSQFSPPILPKDINGKSPNPMVMPGQTEPLVSSSRGIAASAA